MTGILAAYRARLAEGALRPDPAQAAAVEKFASLAAALAGYRPAQAESGWLSYLGLGGRNERRPPWNPGNTDPPVYRQGLYLYGDVGHGKSMLMDLFFAHAPLKAKRRVHFHAFMRDVHDRLHRLQRLRRREGDPIPPVARDIAESAWLLCFDELQVTDIGDAMILGRLFQALFDLGVVVVATSNRPPDDLYKDGLQRQRFLPFIAQIKERLDILELNGARDYRLGRRSLPRYYTPLGAEAEAGLARCFGEISGGLVPTREAVTVLGRTIEVPRAGAGVAWFGFDALCRQAYGPADYLALATLYHTFILADVPVMTADDRDAAWRFVTLVDALYEHRVALICSAAAPAEALYRHGDGAFEFRRTASRLAEMQSAEYAALAHLT